MTTAQNTNQLCRALSNCRNNRRRIAAIAMALTMPLTISTAFAQYKDMPMDDVNLQNPDYKTIFNVAPNSVFKGATKIAIPVFTVETGVKTGAGVRVEGSAGKVSQSVTYVLSGVPQKEMQAAVDKRYDDLVADLKTAGIDVVTPEQMMATAAYKKSAPTLTSPNLQTGNGSEAMVYSARGMTLGLSNSRYIFTNTISKGAGKQIDMLINAAKVVGQIMLNGVGKFIKVVGSAVKAMK